MDITKGLNNLTNLYNKNDFEVIRYNLVYNSYKTSLYYTNINGLGHQTHVKFYINDNQYLLSFDIEIDNNIRKIKPYLGDNYSLISPLFKAGEKSLKPFFEHLFTKLEHITVSDIENYKYSKLKHGIKQINYPDTYKPYLETTVTAKISQEMKDKINNIYGWKQGNKIINILERYNLTLRYTNDIDKANSIKFLFKDKLNINLDID